MWEEKATSVHPPKGFWMLKRSLLLLLFFWLAHSAEAQRKCRWIPLSDSSFLLDSASVLPPSIQVQNPDWRLEYLPAQGKARFVALNPDVPRPDSILVCYQTLPFRLGQAAYKRNPGAIDSTGFFTEVKNLDNTQPGNSQREEIFRSDGLQKNGNLTRGISFGNQQNVFVNSALNLQLEGQVSEDISISAVISDQNIPFQPDGNTQQIQEFDRIFVQLKRKQSSLNVGDIVLQNRPQSEFMRFYKNVQGVQLDARYLMTDSSQARTIAGVGIAKGKFASVAITPIEGVQGPYRLQGPNQERFIIIIANSEKVYIDGRPLMRGFNLDYVIDYNAAEITFNPNVLITQFTRIRIDYEYAERNYSRTNLQASHEQQWGAWSAQLNFFSESDNPRQPLLLDLGDEDKFALSQIGDDLSQAFIRSIDSVGFTENQILYRRTDSTTAQGTFREIYVFSNNPTEAFFRLNFTEVGPNRGNYVLSNENLNGRVFRWVEPLNGIPQGNFEPVRLIPTPAKRQLITAGIGYQINAKERIAIEAAISERDLNRYSSLDNEDNQGYAFKLAYENKGKPSFLKNYLWNSGLSYEFNNRFFNPIDRFRPIEFNRDWNIPLDTLLVPTPLEDHIAQAHIGLQKDPNNLLRYGFTYRNRGFQANGWQQEAKIRQSKGILAVQVDAFWMESTQQELFSRRPQQASWQRLSADLALRGRYTTQGYVFSSDQNTLRFSDNDSVAFTAMNFVEHRLYVKNSDSLRSRFGIEYAFRNDRLPLEGRLVERTQAQTLQARYEGRLSPSQELSFTGTYRLVNNRFPVLAGTEAFDENLLTRLDWRAFFLEKSIRSELTFLTGTGRELRREFAFLQVPTGEGTHTWRDDNGDGLQQLEEFYLAINPDERNFIKIFTPTDGYTLAFSKDFNYRLNMQFPNTWAKAAGLRRWLARFSALSVWNTRQKTTDSDLLRRFVPFGGNINDTTVLSQQDNLRSTLFFNRSNPQYGWDAGYLSSQQKQLLTSGFEIRRLEEWQVNTRNNLLRYHNLQVQAKWNRLENRSDFLLNRNYLLQSYQISPTWAYQPQNDFRISLSYLFADKQNLEEGNEKALWNQWAIEMRWNKLSKRNLIGIFKLIDIRYDGEVNSPVGYELLEALQAGRNLTWSLNWQQRLANGLQINLSYEGRQSPERPIVHLGRMQVALLF